MRIRHLLISLLLLSVSLSAFAQDTTPRTLTVNGEVEWFVKADRAKVQFDIRGLGNSLNTAFTDARSKLDSLANKLYALGLSKDDLATSFFQSQENLWGKAFLSSKRDYQAVMTVTVTTDRMDLLEEIVFTISESRVDRIGSIWFELIDSVKPRQDALLQAIQVAKDKAALIATSLGVNLGEVQSFEEMDPKAAQSSGDNRLWVSARADVRLRGGYEQGYSEDPSIFSEHMRFEVEVKVVYALLP